MYYGEIKIHLIAQQVDYLLYSTLIVVDSLYGGQTAAQITASDNDFELPVYVYFYHK